MYYYLMILDDYGDLRLYNFTNEHDRTTAIKIISDDTLSNNRTFALNVTANGDMQLG